jgi:hypothetical protein
MADHNEGMLEMKAAIRYLKSELNGVIQAINVFETIATEHYADREQRANQKLAHAKHHQKGSNKAVNSLLFTPPHHLNPDPYLWLQ